MIDWALLGQAVSFYKNQGFQYVEAPWCVEPHVSQITFGGELITCQYGVLVGSAEQSLLSMPDLPSVPLVAVTPCFRSDPPDALHQPYFMKVELYQEGNNLDFILASAEYFHTVSSTVKPMIEETHEGFDITINGIEVGSYGVRTHNDRTWSYGTGLALPRFTTANA